MVFDPRIRDAFSLVKADIKALKGEMLSINKRLDEIFKKLDTFLNEKASKTPKTLEFEGIKPQNVKIDSSTGNEGVQSINQAPINQSINHQSITKTKEMGVSALKNELETRFNSLTRQEFLLFLTIYQLEEDLQRAVNYNDISQKMGLTKSGIRGYISLIMQKGLPLRKKKLHNKSTTLTIDPDFRELGIKQRLFNLFYRQDPDQTSLFD